MNFNKIGFVGFGLIGASIAKKIRNDSPNTHIIATARHQSTIDEAYSINLIDNISQLEIKDFNDCDLIFLCAPVQYNIEYLKELKPIIKEDCIITDVGSTKAAIHKEVKRLGLQKNFIGGHPMTGSEKTGVANSNMFLLENAYYIITPTEETSKKTLEEFEKFIRKLNSIPMVLDYKFHDYATGAISHLPHMIAYSLVDLVKEIDSEDEVMKTIAAGGFRDMTRIASSSAAMWKSICQSNTEEIVKLIDLFVDKLQYVKNNLNQEKFDELYDFFQEGKNYRDSLAVPKRRLQQMVYELYIDLVDEAGGIATIATLLATNQISIKNIGIINNREFEEGVLRIEFYDEESQKFSKKLLESKNYTIYQR